MKKYTFKTRHALLMSLTSLMLCVSMLFGATFAWFTDSVTSGVNRIVSGNLDVELYHNSGITAPAIEEANKVGASTQLFDAAYIDPFNTLNANYQLWEPGAMTVETFTVVNKGNLALKYQLALDSLNYNTVTWDEETTPHNLTEVIKLAIKDGTVANRTAAEGLTYGVMNTNALKTAALEPGASETFTVVLYWKADTANTDNLYNLNNGKKADDNSDKLYINLGIKLNATQYTSEADSFDNQYDNGADLPENDTGAIAAAATVLSTTGNTTAKTANNAVQVTVPQDLAEDLQNDGVTSVKVITEGLNINNTVANQVTVSYDDVDLVDQDGNKVDLSTNTKDIIANIFVGENVPATSTITIVLDKGTDNEQTFTYDPSDTGSKLKYNDSTAGNTYDPSTGYAKVTVRHFCPAEITVTGIVAKTGTINDSSTTLTYYTVATVAKAVETGKEITVLATGEDASTVNSKIEAALENKAAAEYVQTDSGWAVASGVAMIGSNFYTTLQDALDEAVSGDTVKLLKDITVSDYVKGNDYCKLDLAVKKVPYGVTLDGGNHTVTLANQTESSAAIGKLYGTLQNISFKGMNGPVASDAYMGAVFNGVTTSGVYLGASGNDGGFVIYVWGGAGNELTFNNCVADIDMTGTGTETDYNAPFVGYMVYSTNYTVRFTNCVNKGDIICGSAGLFIGNPRGYTGKIVVTDCKNEGIIRRTFVQEGQYRVNQVLFGTVSDYGTAATIDGVSYTMTQIKNHEADNLFGTFQIGSSGSTLALSKNADNTFTVTGTEGAAKYVVNLGLYTSLIAGGSTRNYVSETLTAPGETQTQMKDLAFVDAAWAGTNQDAASEGVTYGENTYTVYTLGDTSYYLINNTDRETLNGNAKAATLYSVSAYDANGMLIASAGLSE